MRLWTGSGDLRRDWVLMYVQMAWCFVQNAGDTDGFYADERHREDSRDGEDMADIEDSDPRTRNREDTIDDKIMFECG